MKELAGKRVLVTGASGFIGAALCRRLVAVGCIVFGLARRGFELSGVQSVQGDITAPDLVEKLSRLGSIDIVFHVAAKVAMWGPYEEFYRGNVVATENLLKWAKSSGVGQFVFTSSPSVIAGTVPLTGVDESVPYPRSHLAPYAQTKMVAEQRVLAANAPGFSTLALRPHLVFGPGDTSLTEAVLSKARAGKLVRVGSGKNIVDFTYIDDCVEAHLLAAVGLIQNASAVGGQPFFISQGDPVSLWWWIAEVLRYNKLPPLRRKISAPIATLLSFVLELWAKATGTTPRFTRFLVHEMSVDHYFSIQAAREKLGFVPSCSVAEGLAKTFANRS